MTFDVQSAKPQIGHALTAPIAALARVGAKAIGMADVALKAIQLARMTSILSRMSDQHLALIGISRADIPEYAKRLMAGG